MNRCKSLLAALLCLCLIEIAASTGCNRTAGTRAGKSNQPFKNFTTGKAERRSDLTAATDKPKRLIMLTNGDDPFWDAMRAGMEDAERKLKLVEAGFKVEMDKNDGTPKGQLDKLTQYSNQTDIAAVALSVTDARNTQIADAMRRLLKEGIVVVAIDSDVDRNSARDARFAYMGTDNIIAGRELGKAAKGLRPKGAKYATFVGLKSAANAIERTQGFAEGAGVKEIEYLGDRMISSTAQKNVRDALDRHPEIDTLVGIWAYNADAIAQTVKQRGIRDKISVLVFDAAEPAIVDMAEGLIDAMVVQNPYRMGYDGVRLMKALVEDDKTTVREMFPAWDPEKNEFTKPDGDIIITGLKVVVPNEKSSLKKELFESDTEFMTLPEFKAWLAERKLKNS
jgi:ribose transport system substrate-binding protein